MCILPYNSNYMVVCLAASMLHWYIQWNTDYNKRKDDCIIEYYAE